MTIFQRLEKKMEADIPDIKVKKFHRCYSGMWTRDSAFSWTAETSIGCIGSYETATRLLRYRRLKLYPGRSVGCDPEIGECD
jgi:hypothetical protein